MTELFAAIALLVGASLGFAAGAMWGPRAQLDPDTEDAVALLLAFLTSIAVVGVFVLAGIGLAKL